MNISALVRKGFRLSVIICTGPCELIYFMYKNCGKNFYFQIKSQKVFSGENFSKDFLKDSEHFFADKTKFSKEKNLSMVQYL